MVGFIFWYRGLVLGGISGVGQLQLLQPLFGLLLAAVFLGEPVAWGMIASAAAVVVCVAATVRSPAFVAAIRESAPPAPSRRDGPPAWISTYPRFAAGRAGWMRERS